MYTPYPKDAIILSIIYLNRISRLPLSTPLPPKGQADDPHQQQQHEATNQPTPSTPIDPETITATALLPSVSFPSHPTSATSLPSPPLSPPDSSTDFSPGSVPPPSAAAAGTSNPSPTPVPLLSSFTLHRLLLACLLVAAKFSSDGFVAQARAAKVGGVATRELVRLEVEVLKLLGWQLEWEMDEVEEVAAAVWAVADVEGLLPSGEKHRAEADPAPPTPTSLPVSNSPPAPTDYFPPQPAQDLPASPPLRPLTPTPPTSPTSPALSSPSPGARRSSLDDDEAAEEQQWQDLLAGKIARKPSLNRKLAARGGGGPSQPGSLQRAESCETIKLREGVGSIGFGEVGRVEM